MAKNKNQNRKQQKNGPQNRSSQAQHAQEETHRPEREAQGASISPAEGGPAQSAGKQKKSFGHN